MAPPDDDTDDIRGLLEKAVADDAPPPDIADPPELGSDTPPPEPNDGRQRDELGRFAPKAEDTPPGDKRSRRAAQARNAHAEKSSGRQAG